MTKTTSTWYEFYKQRINSGYQKYFEARYEPFLDAIIQLRNINGIIELGCGIGSVSKAIGGNFSGIDIDPLMVQLANQNTKTTNFSVGSIFEEMFPDSTLKVTHGVLEHFEDSEIESFCSNCLNSIHYVPLDKYKNPSFGDERLLPYEHWLELATPKSWMLFNQDHDLMFIL